MHLLALLVAVSLSAQDTGSLPPPAYQRVLIGEDAKKVEDLQGELNRLQRDGKFVEAIKPAEAILAIRVRAQGQDHWQACDARRELDVCRKLADLPRAEQDEYAAALKSEDEADGLGATGRYEDAELLLRRLLAVRRRVLGEGHPDTARSFVKVAFILAHQGKEAEAEPLFRQALDTRKRVLGEEHPSTALSYNSVALSLGAQGKYAEAEPLLRKAMEIVRRVLGEEHPDTANSYNNVAYNLRAQGKYAEAEPLYRQALEIDRRVLGEAKRWLRELQSEQRERLVAEHKPQSAERGIGVAKGPSRAAVATARPYEHPYYWGAFILIGDPQ